MRRRCGSARQALAEATGRSEKQVNKEYDEEGDLGIVAATARAKQKSMFKPKPLSISGVPICLLFHCQPAWRIAFRNRRSASYWKVSRCNNLSDLRGKRRDAW